MLHLRDTMPRFFHPEQSTSSMFPNDIFSQNVVLKLPAPLPLKVRFSATIHGLLSRE